MQQAQLILLHTCCIICLPHVVIASSIGSLPLRILTILSLSSFPLVLQNSILARVARAMHILRKARATGI